MAMTPSPPFTTVLVANRGEIACRVIRTLQSMGIRAVAVYSDADAEAKHVRMADAAVRLGPARASESYLSIPAVLAAAKESGADAIHPGYGFLSENAAFATACADAGIVFIGPGVEALEVMGDKIRSKRHVEQRGVPTVPGIVGSSDAELIDAANRMGFPLLVKPSAGGGGKGMVVVRDAAELPEALTSARRVAAAAFGDDTLLLERLIGRPRHIEVQVLADQAGHTIHLGERECSLQRRHQKIIEEAPSALLDAATRARIGDAACEVARSVHYVGAGTVEFLVAADRPDEFFFIEMNTRLQVEHPVTEAVVSVRGASVDLVEWQVRIAAGEPLALQQDDVRFDGHAIEARVYAETPAAGFLPSTGTVLVCDEPSGDGIRVDSALVEGIQVTADYDPILAKVIAHAGTRMEALERLDRALAETVILGVDTNIAFLRALLARPEVRAGELDTGLIERALPQLNLAAEPDDPWWDAAAEVATLLHVAGESQAGAVHHLAGGPVPQPGRFGASAGAPWVRDGWRLGQPRPHGVRFAGRVAPVAVRAGAASSFRSVVDGRTVWLARDGVSHRFTVQDRASRLRDHLATRTRAAGAGSPEVRSVMPGTVVALGASTGAAVAVGQPLVTIEAMKMEHSMLASVAGVVTLNVCVGDQVALNQVVARVEPSVNEGAS
jgi:acetyl-CoA/propionyl-CoA carboxylase biotin carboxyl carrier protein